MEIGDRVGDFLLLEKLGEGGFGEVWKAVRSGDMQTPLALKVATRPEAVSALRKEGVLLHALSHPCIVPILEARTDADPPYLVMEYVPGRSLRARLDEVKRLAPKEAVLILLRVLEALSCAHASGLVHRDVKPGNVLLREDRDAVLSDFGLGKVTKATSIHLSGQNSSVRSIAGTFDYMSPEQRRGDEGDHRVDLYACGVLLYEMLTGEVHPLKLPVREAPRALSDVVERAVETEAARRFPSAAAMAEALRAALTVVAAPRAPETEGVLSRVVTRVKRWFSPPPVVAPYWSVRREVTLLKTLAGATAPALAAALDPVGTLLAVAGGGGRVLIWHVGGGRLLTALTETARDVRSLAFAPDGDVLAVGDVLGEVRTWTMTRGREKRTFRTGAEPVQWLSFSPDGSALVALAKGVHAWSHPLGEPLELAGVPSRPTCATFSQDGWMLAVGCEDGTVRIWNALKWRSIRVFHAHAEKVTSLYFRPDGRALVTSCADGTARVWRVPEGMPVSQHMEHEGAVARAVFNGDGRWIATGGDDGIPRIWSGVDGALVRALPKQGGALRSVLFTPDGAALLTLTAEGEMKLLSVPDGRPLCEVCSHEGPMVFGAFTRNGCQMITAGKDGLVREWLVHGGPAADWTTREEDDYSTPKIDVAVAGEGVARAGDVLRLDVTVTNTGTRPISQCWAAVSTEEPWMAGLAFAFGRIGPGESCTRRAWRRLPAEMGRCKATGLLLLHEASTLVEAKHLFEIEVRPLPREDFSVRKELWIGRERVAAGTAARVAADGDLRIAVVVESRVRDPLGRLRLVLERIDDADGTRLEVAQAPIADLQEGYEAAAAVRFSPAETGVRGGCRLELRVEAEAGRVFAVERIDVIVG